MFSRAGGPLPVIIFSLALFASLPALSANPSTAPASNTAASRVIAATAPASASVMSAATAGDAKKASGSWWQSPPGWVTWLNTVGIIVAAIWTLFVYVIGRQDRKGNRHDEFWYRGILGPRCIQPLLNLVDVNLQRLRALEGQAPIPGQQPYRNALALFSQEKATVTNSLFLLTLFDDAAYQKLARELDTIEDVLALHCVANEWGM